MTFLVVVGLAALVQAQGAFTVLYNFTGPPDGTDLYAGLVKDGAGNLYSATGQGGDLTCKNPYEPDGCGVAFAVNAAGTETMLYRFAGPPLDGEFSYFPAAGSGWHTLRYHRARRDWELHNGLWWERVRCGV